MPDISASLELLGATFFLYHCREDAIKGTKYGGSGVIIGAPLNSRPDLALRYAVSNWHVVCKDGASVIRLSLPDGRIHIVDTDPSEWTFLPGQQDLAAIPLQLPKDMSPAWVSTSQFVDGETSDAHVGDDVFMVGRFVDFDGIETNKPATRFGTISLMDAPITQQTGYRGNSIVADMHSRTGFSGSPVYVYRPGTTRVLPFSIPNPSIDIGKIDVAKVTRRKWGVGNNVVVRLLGIHWGQFPELWEIKMGLSATASQEHALVTEGAYVRGLSGMTCIIPACDIINLLNHPELKSVRDNL
ncbi:serine protease [Sphingobium terrigena]|uniref:Serine protease n=1 Tax=Sphingobium terrigena TaxID=2304063 RepID=A0A418YV67_9SPHN|nr:serine protease [Sphingobium terrigena]RJG56130.1 serine protease [Sphingobium terrigena]